MIALPQPYQHTSTLKMDPAELNGNLHNYKASSSIAKAWLVWMCSWNGETDECKVSVGLLEGFKFL